MLTAGFLMAGLIVGSFLNVCIWRMPRDESIAWPPSHCSKCNHPIRWHDNMPVLSFLILKGACRDCRSPISRRYPLVEILSGTGFVCAYALYGLSAYAAAFAFLWALSLVIVFVDAEFQIIPDEINFLGLGAGIVFSYFFGFWLGAEPGLKGLSVSLLGAAAGGALLAGLAALGSFLLKKDAMGGGDVKMMAFIGAWSGWEGVLLTLFLASFGGSLAGVFIKYVLKKDRIPFGPFLAAAFLVNLVYRENIFQWYFNDVLQLNF